MSNGRVSCTDTSLSASALSTQHSALAEGVRLFNAGHFWHAHEQWEECWRVAAEPDASFFKGIIQAAAALVHWQRGNNVGLRRNWAKSRPKLAALPPTYAGVDVAALSAAMDAFVAADPLPNVEPPRIALIPPYQSANARE